MRVLDSWMILRSNSSVTNGSFPVSALNEDCKLIFIKAVYDMQGASDAEKNVWYLVAKMEAALKKWNVKTWALVALGGVAVVASAAFVIQSKHAALGRQVHRNVMKFLQDHGSQVHSGVISGGLVSTPMKTTTAVNSTVVSMLNGYADMLSQGSSTTTPGAPGGGAGEPVYTGKEGIQGVGIPSASPHPSPRGSRASAASAPSLMDLAKKDEAGFLSPERNQQTEYNPSEFVPSTSKPPADIDLFAGDGIPTNPSSCVKQYE